VGRTKFARQGCRHQRSLEARFESQTAYFTKDPGLTKAQTAQLEKDHLGLCFFPLALNGTGAFYFDAALLPESSRVNRRSHTRGPLKLRATIFCVASLTKRTLPSEQ
jgi:hypothetical protein